MRGRKYLFIVLVVTVTTGVVSLISYRVLYPWIVDYRVHRRLTELADQGDPAYQRLLAEYLFKKGDFASAFQWEVKSAEAGDPIAQNFMGYYFSYGICYAAD